MTASYYTRETLQQPANVGYLVKRCGALAMQIAEQAFEAQPVTFTQWMVLSWLRGHPHLTPTEISGHFAYDMGAMTRLVDCLHEQKFVRRERCEEDRRAVRISITAAGRRVLRSSEDVVLLNANRIVEIYTRTETAALISLLQRLLVHMEHCTARPAAKITNSPRPTSRRRK